MTLYKYEWILIFYAFKYVLKIIFYKCCFIFNNSSYLEKTILKKQLKTIIMFLVLLLL